MIISFDSTGLNQRKIGNARCAHGLSGISVNTKKKKFSDSQYCRFFFDFDRLTAWLHSTQFTRLTSNWKFRMLVKTFLECSSMNVSFASIQIISNFPNLQHSQWIKWKPKQCAIVDRWRWLPSLPSVSYNVNFPSKTCCERMHSNKLYLQTNLQLQKPSTVCYVFVIPTEAAAAHFALAMHAHQAKASLFKTKCLNFKRDL